MWVANGTILRSAVPEKQLWQNSLRTFSPPTWVDNFSLHLTRILCSIWLHGPFNLWKSLFSGCPWYHGFRVLFPSFFPFHSSTWVLPSLPLTLGFSRAQSLVFFSSLWTLPMQCHPFRTFTECSLRWHHSKHFICIVWLNDHYLHKM